MDHRATRYHPQRFEIIRGDDDERLDFWESLEQSEATTDRSGPFATTQVLVTADESARLSEAEEIAWDNYTAYEDAGRQIFSFPPALVQMFLNSSVEDVPTSYLLAPYNTFFMHFGADAGIRSAATGLPIDGVYVDIANGLHLRLWATPVAPWIEEARHWPFLKRIREDQKLGYLDKFLGFDEGPTFGEILAAPFANPYAQMSELEYFRHERKMEDYYVKRGAPRLRITPYREAIDQWAPSEQELLWREQTDKLARLVINAILYLAYYEPDAELDYPGDAPQRLVNQARSAKPTEARRAASKLASMGYRKVYLCGRHFAGPSTATAESTSPSAHWRRGHWRQQACGPGRKQHKLNWIMPTLVNTRSARMIHGHIYHSG